MSKRVSFLSAALRHTMLPTLLCLGACDDTSGTDTGNPFTQPLTVDAHSSDPGEVAIAIPQGGTLVTESWLSIDKVGISEVCGMPADLTFEEQPLEPLGVADHAAEEALHRDFEARATTYCDMQVPWILATAGGDVPAEVVGTAIYLAGETSAGTTFVLRSALTGTVVVSAVNESFALAEDRGGLFLGFDLATWLNGVELDDATLEVDGSILIDASTNANLLTLFEANVAAGLELYRDADNNGRPDGVDDILLAKGTP